MSEGQQITPYEGFRTNLNKLSSEIAAVLPQHISVDRFKRVVLTAVQSDPDLLVCESRSLFESCLRCATDGLIPDKREAALVVFNAKAKAKDKSGRDVFIKKAQYMPMARGLIKMIRQSGEIKTITAQIVHEKDEWQYDLAGDARPVHCIPREGGRGKAQFAYAMVVFKDDSFQVELMDRAQAEKIRAVSKSNSGPWQAWEEEMWRKSVLRRLCKYLSLSAEQNRALERDNVFYDLALANAASAHTASIAAAKPAPLRLDASFPEPAKRKAKPAPEPTPESTIVESETVEIEAEATEVVEDDSAAEATETVETVTQADAVMAGPALSFEDFEKQIGKPKTNPLDLINQVAFAGSKIAIDQETLAQVWILAAPHIRADINGTLPEALSALAACADIDTFDDLVSHIENQRSFNALEVSARKNARATMSALREHLSVKAQEEMESADA